MTTARIVARLYRTYRLCAYHARHPRPWLLERAHTARPWWLTAAATLGAGYLLHLTVPAWVLTAGPVLAAPFVLVDVAAQLVHAAWGRYWLWLDVECAACHGDDDPGDDDQDVDGGPDGPEDYGLTPADLQFLDLISTGAGSRRPHTEDMP